MKPLLDGAICTTSDAWNVESFGQDLSDSRTELYLNDGYNSVHRVTPNRPRTLGVRFGHRF
jgi:hypothetical protein